MKIPVWLASAIVGAFLAGHGWLILAVIDLKTDMATVKAIVSAEQQANNIAKK